MQLLALDTSTECMALGLASGGRSWTHEAAGGAAASQALIPAVLTLLTEAGLTMSSLEGIAYGQGPGAFTGVRTAVSVVQGLAYALDLPTVPIDSLQIFAEDAAAQIGAEALRDGDVVWALADARMGEVYAAAYAWVAQPGRDKPDAIGHWQALSAPALLSLEATVAALEALPPQHACGSALAALGLAAHLPPGAQVWAQCVDRAAALLRLARQHWLAGVRRAPADALPVYLRDKVALTTAERAREHVLPSSVAR